jgi:hypothetical protein
MDRCPNCRARLDGSEHCRRCGMELGLLLAADDASQRAIARAIRRLAGGDQEGAIQALEQARALSADGLVIALLAFARLSRDAELRTPSPENADAGPSAASVPGGTNSWTDWSPSRRDWSGTGDQDLDRGDWR